jgi:hypothetical protein
MMDYYCDKTASAPTERSRRVGLFDKLALIFSGFRWRADHFARSAASLM